MGLSRSRLRSALTRAATLTAPLRRRLRLASPAEVLSATSTAGRSERERAIDWLHAAGGVARAGRGTWYVGGLAVASEVLRDGTTFSSEPMAAYDATLLGSDAASHWAIRGPLAAAYGRDTLGPRARATEAVAAATLRAMAAAGERDLVQGFAEPFTTLATWSALGVDLDVEEALVLRAEIYGQMRAPGQVVAAPRLDALVASLYAAARAGDVRTPPIAALATIPSVMGSAEAFRGAFRLLLSASTTTTSHAIGSAAWWLARRPETEAALRADRSGIPAVVREVLRLEPPVYRTVRRATEAAEVGGVRIPAGATVEVLLAAANRDPAAFDDPHTFRPGRPGRALPFGHGPHYCIGHAWARQDLAVALGALLDAIPSLAVEGDPEAVPFATTMVHGPVSLRLAMPPRRA